MSKYTTSRFDNNSFGSLCAWNRLQSQSHTQQHSDPAWLLSQSFHPIRRGIPKDAIEHLMQIQRRLFARVLSGLRTFSVVPRSGRWMVSIRITKFSFIKSGFWSTEQLLPHVCREGAELGLPITTYGQNSLAIWICIPGFFVDLQRPFRRQQSNERRDFAKFNLSTTTLAQASSKSLRLPTTTLLSSSPTTTLLQLISSIAKRRLFSRRQALTIVNGRFCAYTGQNCIDRAEEERWCRARFSALQSPLRRRFHSCSLRPPTTIDQLDIHPLS